MKPQNTPIANSQSGNVFFYILLAIGLVAALTYVVSRDNRAGTAMLTDEQAKLAANEIIEYGNTLSSAIQKLRLRGCDDAQISAQKDWDGSGTITDTSADAYISDAPPNKSCHLFEVGAGNINYRDFNEGEFKISGAHRIETIGCDDADTACAELSFALKNISETLCQSINDRLGLALIPTDADGGETAGFSLHAGYASGGGSVIGDEDTNLQGLSHACYLDSDDNNYIYYRVLLTR